MIALYAVTYYQDVGIDMEYVQYNKEYEQIAEHFFSVRERNLLSVIQPIFGKRHSYAVGLVRRLLPRQEG